MRNRYATHIKVLNRSISSCSPHYLHILVAFLVPGTRALAPNRRPRPGLGMASRRMGAQSRAPGAKNATKPRKYYDHDEDMLRFRTVDCFSYVFHVIFTRFSIFLLGFCDSCRFLNTSLKSHFWILRELRAFDHFQPGFMHRCNVFEGRSGTIRTFRLIGLIGLIGFIGAVRFLQGSILRRFIRPMSGPTRTWRLT